MEKRKRNKREMKKKIWLIGLIILTGGVMENLSFAEYKPGSELDGFRGIKWGTNISTLKDMEHFMTNPDYGGIEMYSRKNEDLHIGRAKLERIKYGFWKGSFGGVYVITKGYENWTGLKDAVFEKYGRGYQENGSIEDYLWFNNTTGITLEYNKVSEEGEFCMFSIKISKQQEAYKKQKAKEGAEKGF